MTDDNSGDLDEAAGSTPKASGSSLEAADASANVVLELSKSALRKVLQLRAEEPDAASLALWVQIGGVNGSAYSYEMFFQAASDAAPDDWSSTQGDLTVVVPAASIPEMTGSVLDMSRDLLAGGMVIRNPNTPPHLKVR